MEAQALLLPFVRKKRGDFWAWHVLGKMEEGTDPERALALYAKACLTCGDPKFGVNVFEDLSRVASENGQVGLPNGPPTKHILFAVTWAGGCPSRYGIFCRFGLVCQCRKPSRPGQGAG